MSIGTTPKKVKFLIDSQALVFAVTAALVYRQVSFEVIAPDSETWQVTIPEQHENWLAATLLELKKPTSA